MRSGLEPRQNDVRPCKFKSLSALTFLRQIDPFNISNNKLTQNIIGKATAGLSGGIEAIDELRFNGSKQENDSHSFALKAVRSLL